MQLPTGHCVLRHRTQRRLFQQYVTSQKFDFIFFIDTILVLPFRVYEQNEYGDEQSHRETHQLPPQPSALIQRQPRHPLGPLDVYSAQRLNVCPRLSTPSYSPSPSIPYPTVLPAPNPPVSSCWIPRHHAPQIQYRWSPIVPSPGQFTLDPPSIELKPGKVYYLPDGNYVPQRSVVHTQKQQEGFFRHPVLVVLVDYTYAHFYALTRVPPTAIRDLKMCLRIGATSEDEGSDVLRLEKGSGPMTHETWVNLEQRFKIEKAYLTHWSVEVKIDPIERHKLETRVEWLESEQNRFIYKPLSRDLSGIQPGMVLMLKNPPGSSTLGAPVLIIANSFPRFRFLRVKQMSNSAIWDEPLVEDFSHARRNCLAIVRNPRPGHDGTPVMLLTPNSPELREPSYIEMSRKPKWGSAMQFLTWCWPPIQLQPWSMKLLFDYMSHHFHPTVNATYSPGLNNDFAIFASNFLGKFFFSYVSTGTRALTN